MRWAWGMAAVVICAVGCGGGPKGGAKPPRPPDPVPASMPNAILHTPPPKLVPDTAFDYDYTTRYEWPNQNNRDYDLVVEHDCRILFIPTGGGKQRFATMQLSEFWALDANGQMDAHEVDRIRRAALAGQGITDAVECCNYHVHGVRVKSGLPVSPSRSPSRRPTPSDRLTVTSTRSLPADAATTSASSTARLAGSTSSSSPARTCSGPVATATNHPSRATRRTSWS